MAAENEIQFFEAPFQYQIGEFQSNVNLTYHKLINTRPVKMPQLNTGFETPFSQAYNEKGDKSYFAIRKREGFQRCKGIEEEFQFRNRIITDHQIVNGRRFLMCCNNEFSKLYIYTKEAGRYIDCDPNPQDICLGDWERIGSYDTTPCAYHKFQKITTLQSKEEKKKTGVRIGTVVYEGGSTTSILFNENFKAIDGLITGQFIQLYHADEEGLSVNDTVVGQALQLGEFDAEHGWYNMGYGSWIGITDKQQMDLFDNFGNKIGVINYQSDVDILVYDKAELGIAFYGGKESKDQFGIWEWNGHGFTFLYQTNQTHADITSLTEDFDGLVYTTDRGTVNFMRPHSNTGQSLGGTIYSSNHLYGNWDLAKACGDYVFLFGPDTIGIAYKNGTDERGDYRWNIQVLDRNMGYFNKDSVLVFNEEMYMIDNKKRFVKLDLEATTDSYYRVHFKLTATDMSLHRINTDLRNLDKERGDKVSLCKSGTRIYIIIQDNRNVKDISDEDNYMNTKILVYEDELKYRHRWYAYGCDIRGIHDGVWFGRGVRLNQGDYDGDENNKYPIKQIISMTFGDTSWFTWKEVLWIKAAIGYHSQISENTIFKFRADGGGFSKTIKMNTLHNTAYIEAITSLRESGKTNINDIEKLFRAMPIGIGIYSGNGVGLIEDIQRTAQKEFDRYYNYEPTLVYKKDTCCDPKPASEADDNGCTMKEPKADEQNFGSDRFQYHYNIAKYGVLPIDIGQQGQNFYFELIANEYDSIEFLGFMIGRMFMDNNFDSIMNKPFYKTTPKDSLPGMMGK